MLKKTILGLFLFLICVFTAVGVFFYGTYKKVHVTANLPKGVTQPPKEDTFNNEKPFTVVLLGYGGGGHEGGKLTDSIIMAHVVPQRKKVFLISIPRDVWVSLPVNGEEESGWKINAAYAIGADDRNYRNKLPQYTGDAGGGELSKFALNQVTGIRPDKFVAVSFNGFEKSIDVLGGVNVNVEKTFDDYLYPIEGKEDDPCGKTDEELKAAATMSASVNEKTFSCRYEHLHFDKGITHMTGGVALKYVRSRHSAQDGTDFGRAARQRNLIVAVKERVISLNFFPKIIPFISSLTNDLKTDISIEDMQTFLKYKDELVGYDIINLALTQDNMLIAGRSQNGQQILMSKEGLNKWDETKQWITYMIEHDGVASESATPATASAKPLKAKPSSSSAAPNAQ